MPTLHDHDLMNTDLMNDLSIHSLSTVSNCQYQQSEFHCHSIFFSLFSHLSSAGVPGPPPTNEGKRYLLNYPRVCEQREERFDSSSAH